MELIQIVSPDAELSVCGIDGCFPSAQSVVIPSIVDPVLLQTMITDGYIMARSHPDDKDLQILSYGVRTQIEGKWNDATKIARGLIIRTQGDDLANGVIVQRPWAKFFTLNQMEGAWHLGDEENPSSAEDAFASLDFQAPAEVYDKMDGSLGILYRDPKGAPALATKGTFISEQAKMFTAMLHSDPVALAVAEAILQEGSITALFELVGPGNRIVLSYDENAIVLIGGVNKQTGANITPETIGDWTARGLPTVERMEAESLEEAFKLEPRENREGVVVSIGGSAPMKIKIKQNDYLRLHRIVTMFSPRESRNLVKDLEASYADLLALAADEDVEIFEPIKEVLNIDGFKKGEDSYELIRSTREGYFKEILLPQARKVTQAKAVIEGLDESYFAGAEASKKFAAIAKTLPADESSLYALFRARLKGIPLEELSAFHELRKAIRNVKSKDD